MAQIKFLLDGTYHDLNKFNVMSSDPALVLNKLSIREDDDGLLYIIYDGAPVGEGYEIDRGPIYGVSVPSVNALAITEGSTDKITVRLSRKPSSAQVVEVSTSGDANITVSPKVLTFASENWNVPQEVFISTVKDDNDTDETASIHLTTTNSVKDVSVNVIDTDEFFGDILTVNALELDEEGTTTVAVKLNRKPTNNQAVSVASSNSAMLSVFPSALTFTPTNYDTEQILTVSAAKDQDTENNEYSLTLSTTNSTKTITVKVMDNDIPETVEPDQPGATYANVAATPVISTVKEGESTSVAVQLASQPSVRQVVVISPANESLLSVSPKSMLFTPENWNVPQTLTITALRDNDVENDIVLVDIKTNNAVSATLNVNVFDADATADAPLEPVLPITIYNNRRVDEKWANTVQEKWRKIPVALRQYLIQRNCRVIIVDPAQDSTVRVNSTYPNEDFSTTAGFTYDTTVYLPARESSVEASAVHEIGHVLQNVLRDNRSTFYSAWNNQWTSIMNSEGPNAPFALDDGHEAMFNYHITNAKEYFSETFEYLIEKRVPVSRWQEKAPRTYQFVQDTIDLKYR